MKRIKPILDEYFRDRIDPCSDYPIPISKYDLREAMKELKSYEWADENKEDIDRLKQVIDILNENKVPDKKTIYWVRI